ncbi:hypothetical protein N431DRAFT_441819 [Stipitochalara longipes BDJ]|nr:hypothetical protein N431DRAFT_441819 [Stipitochalara longipes BDJ]
MPVQVRYDTTPPNYAAGFQKWMNDNYKWKDNLDLYSIIRNYDPNSVDHVSVRVSTVELRAQQMWYIVHWRPADGENPASGQFLPQPESQAAKDKRKAAKQAKRARKAGKPQDDLGGDGSGGVTS